MMFFNLCLALLWLAGVSAGDLGTKSVLTTHSIRGPSAKPEGQIQPQYTGFQPGESNVVLHQEVPPGSVAPQASHDQGGLQANQARPLVGQQDAHDQRVPQVGASTVGHSVVPGGGQVPQQYPFFVYQPAQQNSYYYPQQGQQPYFAPQQQQQDQYYGQNYGPVPQQVQQGQFQQPFYAPQQDQYYGQSYGSVPQKGQQQPFYVAQHIPQQQQGPYYGQYGQYPGAVAAPVQSSRYVQIVPYVSQGQHHNRPQIVEVDAITVPIQFLFRSASGQLQFQPVHPSQQQQQQQQVQRTRLEGQTQVSGHEVNKPVPFRRTTQEEVHPIVPKGERPSVVASTGLEEPLQSNHALTSTSSVSNTGSQVLPQTTGQTVDGRGPY